MDGSQQLNTDVQMNMKECAREGRNEYNRFYYIVLVMKMSFGVFSTN